MRHEFVDYSTLEEIIKEERETKQRPELKSTKKEMDHFLGIIAHLKYKSFEETKEFFRDLKLIKEESEK